jgi:hypothetical protein
MEIQSSLTEEELVCGIVKEEGVGFKTKGLLQWGLIIGRLFLPGVLAAVPPRQADRKSSHPLLRVAPGPWGLARVALSTWPGLLPLQLALVWSGPTPQP